MSAKDRFHDVVKTALQKDGWRITHDPLTKSFIQSVIQRSQVNLLVYNVEVEEIVRWQT